MSQNINEAESNINNSISRGTNEVSRIQSLHTEIFNRKLHQLVASGKNLNQAALEAMEFANAAIRKAAVDSQDSDSNDKAKEESTDLPTDSPKLFLDFEEQTTHASEFLRSIESIDRSFNRNSDKSDINGIDIQAIKHFYNNINTDSQDGDIASALFDLLMEVKSLGGSLSADLCIKIAVLIMNFPQLNDPTSDDLIISLSHCLNSIPFAFKEHFVLFLCKNIDNDGLVELIGLFQQLITLRVLQFVENTEGIDFTRRSSIEKSEDLKVIRSAVQTLALIYCASHAFPQIELNEFYNEALNSCCFQINDYLDADDIEYLFFYEMDLWRRERPRNSKMSPSVSSIVTNAVSESMKMDVSEPNNSFPLRQLSSSLVTSLSSKLQKYFSSTKTCIFSYPFVLYPGVKAKLLERYAMIQMQRAHDSELAQALFTGSKIAMPYLVLDVSRDNLVSDTVVRLNLYNDTPTDFKKPLKVIFDNEEGVDAGGVKREFFHLIMLQVLDPSFGMFKRYEESNLIWFMSMLSPQEMDEQLHSSDTNISFDCDNLQEFEMIGTLVGIAIYNSVIINLPMPHVLYRKLKGCKDYSLEDLAELQPSVAKSLKFLLDFEGSPEEFETNFPSMSFDVIGEYFGEKVAYNLRPNGHDIQVTYDNRHEFVELYVKYILDTSIRKQFKAFFKGFNKVCDRTSLDLFEAKELELLVGGRTELDMNDLREGTSYEDGYTEKSFAIVCFWNVVLGFNNEEKKALIKFISGSDRSPIDGLKSLKFKISKNGSDDERLPSAHTCFNHLLLPSYSSEDVMASKLKFAIINGSEGFGLR